MSTSVQQQQTLDYFSSYAAEWRQKAEGSMSQEVNVIKQRNDYVLKVARGLSPLERALDVGCGTGELACDLARLGADTIGVDFAPEMIELCCQKAEKESVKNAEFIETSIFDYKPESKQFDLISANGFIEYISEEQLVRFISQARNLLQPGGSLVVGSRNRLFNLFSLNDYTQMEIDKGTWSKLIAEAILFNRTETMQDLLNELMCADDSLPSFERHPLTGVKVTTRYQYTPCQLVRLLAENGLTSVELAPVHYHGAPPKFARTNAEVHVQIANLINDFAEGNHCLIPFASTFMLHAVKK